MGILRSTAGAASEYVLVVAALAVALPGFALMGGAFRSAIVDGPTRGHGTSMAVSSQAGMGDVPRMTEALAHVKGAAPPVHASEFRRVLGAAAPELFVNVPVVRKGDVVPFVLSDAVPGADARVRALLRERAALRPAAPGQAGELHPYASRYVGLRRDGTAGSARGDGRVVNLGTVELTSPSGAELASEIQAKGVATGLEPRGKTKTDIHRNGELPLLGAFMDAFMGEYLAVNGVTENRSLGIVDLKLPYFHVDAEATPLWGHASTLLRAGDFTRLAHLELLTGQPEAMRAVLALAKERLVASGYGKALTKPVEFFLGLVDHKAKQVADLYWSRAVHGSLTYDNIGLLELFDFGTTTTVDRTHRAYQYSRFSSGYGLEGNRVLGLATSAGAVSSYIPAVARFFETAYGVNVDTLVRNGELLGGIAHQKYLAEGMLEHMGLGPAERALLMESHGPAVNELWNAVEAFGRRRARASYTLDGDALDRPATYNMFDALSVLVSASKAENGAQNAGVRQLVAAMDPLVSRGDAVHEERARALLDAVAPLYDQLMGGLSPSLQNEKLGWISREAARINAPVDVGHRTLEYFLSLQLEEYRAGRLPAERLEADLRAALRAATRRGPSTPPNIAESILRGEPSRFDGDVAVLSKLTDGGARVRELSDGARDWMEVVPEGLALSETAELRYRFGTRGPWRTLRAEDDANGGLVFRVPLSGKEAGFEFTFADRGKTESRGGLPFARNMTVASSSPWVDAALFRWAEGRGVARQITPSRRAALAKVEAGRP